MRFSRSTAAAAFFGGLAICAVVAPSLSQAQISIGVRVNFAPPVLPVYVQPPLPEPGYIWTPGYWAWEPTFADYYWVPGAWVRPPRIGLLWTPGYWGWTNGVYIFNQGYWGPHIGFYGGVNYGFGYGGVGYQGGAWRGGQFYYNRSVNNVTSVNITNVYSQPVSNLSANNRVSFNGGVGGVAARPTSEQMAAASEPHLAPTPVQQQHAQMASQDRSLRASVNHGAPPIAATPRPAALHGPGVVAAAHAAPASGQTFNRADHPAARPAEYRGPGAAAPHAPTANAGAYGYGERPASAPVNAGHGAYPPTASRPGQPYSPRPEQRAAEPPRPVAPHAAAPKPASGEHHEGDHEHHD